MAAESAPDKKVRRRGPELVGVGAARCERDAGMRLSADSRFLCDFEPRACADHGRMDGRMDPLGCRSARACEKLFRLRRSRPAGDREEIMKVLLLLLSAVASASALQLAAPRASVAPLATQRRARPIRLQEKEELTAEQIVAAAEKASGEPAAAWPESQPVPGVVPVAEDVSEGGFDPRIILYVSLPALVLVGQVSRASHTSIFPGASWLLASLAFFGSLSPAVLHLLSRCAGRRGARTRSDGALPQLVGPSSAAEVLTSGARPLPRTCASACGHAVRARRIRIGDDGWCALTVSCAIAPTRARVTCTRNPRPAKKQCVEAVSRAVAAEIL